VKNQESHMDLHGKKEQKKEYELQKKNEQKSDRIIVSTTCLMKVQNKYSNIVITGLIAMFYSLAFLFMLTPLVIIL
jgi:hypothetical protein